MRIAIYAKDVFVCRMISRKYKKTWMYSVNQTDAIFFLMLQHFHPSSRFISKILASKHPRLLRYVEHAKKSGSVVCLKNIGVILAMFVQMIETSNLWDITQIRFDVSRRLHDSHSIIPKYLLLLNPVKNCKDTSEKKCYSF